MSKEIYILFHRGGQYEDRFSNEICASLDKTILEAKAKRLTDEQNAKLEWGKKFYAYMKEWERNNPLPGLAQKRQVPSWAQNLRKGQMDKFSDAAKNELKGITDYNRQVRSEYDLAMNKYGQEHKNADDKFFLENGGTKDDIYTYETGEYVISSVPLIE